MKSILQYNIFFILLLISSYGKSQENLEFVENKGQWDRNIQFKGDMTTGSFILKPDGGYRMLQYDTSSLKTISERIHPTKNTNTITSPSLKSPSQALTSSNDKIVLKGNVYEVKFLNSNPNPVAIPDKIIEQYNNYFIGTDSSKWAGHCRIFTAVTYKNIYPNIDIRYYTDKGNLKYDFIINPGGDANKIIMYIDGATNLDIKKGQLVVKTPVGEVRENIPASYQFNPVTGKKAVRCAYKANGNIVHFSLLEEVDHNATLVIDPQFIFCSFSGSTAHNWGFTSTYDALGNFYAGGIVFGRGFPVSNGAFQHDYAGGGSTLGVDIGVMKFNPLGTQVIYATYIGGSGDEFPHSMVVNQYNQLIVAGKTTSSNYPQYPVSIPHFGPGMANANKFDIILSVLNADGTALVGSRSIGGTSNDGVNIQIDEIGQHGPISIRQNYGDAARSEVIVDNQNNIYLASCTQSNDFPTVQSDVTKGIIQSVHGKNTQGINRYNQDAVVIKTSPDLSQILFSTFLGGDGDDGAFVLALDPTSNLLAVGGATASNDFPGDTTNTIGTHFSGGTCDGFVTLMTNDGSKIIKTTYLGTKGNDVVFGVQYDKSGYPYVLGTTTGNWPVVNAGFVQAGAKQFIAKLQKDLSTYVYSTTFGTTNSSYPNLSPTAFLVDRCENVYASGWGFSNGNATYFTQQGYKSEGTYGLSITNNAIKRTTDGNDFYFFVLEHNATSQLYGSYFGQDGGFPDHVDGGTSRFDKNGVIYQSVCANCGGGVSFPTTQGAAYYKNGSDECNLAAIKIAFNLSGVGANIRSAIKGIPFKVIGCVPLDVEFTDLLGEGNKYIWNYGDKKKKDTTLSPSAKHTYDDTGYYTASVVSIDSTACNIADTSSVVIKVANNEAILNIVPEKTGDCASLNYRFTNNSSATLSSFNNNSFTLYYGDGTKDNISTGVYYHKYPNFGTYKASLWLTDTTYCNAPDSVQMIIRIADTVKAIINTPTVACAPYNAVLQNNSLGGETFSWSFGDGTTYAGSDFTINHLYENAGTYNIKLVAKDSSTCNKLDSTSVVLVANTKPTAKFSFPPNPQTANQAVVFTNQSTEATQFEWIFDDGDTVYRNSETDTITHVFNANLTYRVTLIAFNLSGCADTFYQDVKASVLPFIKIANAIAPNSPDATNRKVKVEGYGIKAIHWVIYNRWGQKVFETTNKDEAWDGRCNGQLQPSEVYTYTLDVTYTTSSNTATTGTSNDHYTKTGDITLLR